MLLKKLEIGYQSMRLLVTGGNGFVGKFIVNHLAENNTVYSPTSKELDLRDILSVMQWFSTHEVDIVIHCALTGREELSSEDPDYLSDGLLMFRNLWQHRDKYQRFIHLGTAYEFDLTKNNEMINGDDILNHLPTTSYGYAKNVAARIIRETPEFYNLRLFGVFHETESDKRFLQRVKSQDEVIIGNDHYIDYVYLPDILPMIDHIVEGPIQHRDINIVYNDKYRLSDIALMLCDVLEQSREKIKILGSNGNNLTGNGELYSQYVPDPIGLTQGLRNYK